MASIQHSLAYRSDIDGLRAIAVLSVLIYHVHPEWLQGGFTGVDVFFVISGYLITNIVSRDIAAGSFSFLRFYQRRIARLYPALLVTISLTLCAGWFLLYANELLLLASHAKYSLLYLINFKLHSESGYFDTSSDFKPLLHLWSLSIEEQFYLLLPVAFAYFSQRRSHFNVCLLIVLISLSYNLYLNVTQSTPPFFLSPARFWQIAVGGLVALAPDRILYFFESRAHPFSLLGLLMILSGLIFTKESNMNPTMLAMLPVVGTSLVLLTGSQSTWVARKLLSMRLMVGVGLISYPLYLLHWPLLAFLRILFPSNRSILADVLVGVLSALLAYATYRFVEKPIRVNQENLSKNALKLFVLSIVMILCCALVIRKEGFKGRSINLFAMATQAKMVRMPHRSESCLAEIVPDSKIDYCLVNKVKEGAPQVALIGDSHAHAIYPGFAEYFAKHGQNLILLSNSSCPMLLDVDTEETSTIQKDCESKKTDILNYLAQSTSLHSVIIASRGVTYISRRGFGPAEPQPIRGVQSSLNSTDNYSPGELFRFGMNRLVAKINQSNLNVFYFLQVPEVGLGPDLCQMRLRGITSNSSNCVQPLEEVLRRHSEYRIAISNVAGMKYVIDPLSEICPLSRCSYLLEGEIIYADDDHLNPIGAKKVIERLSTKLDKFFAAKGE